MAGVTLAAVVRIFPAISDEVVGNVRAETASLMTYTRINHVV
jgi:hypothetical protein